MVSQPATQIARPLPPSRPFPPTPPRGTVYVVERFGRFSRLLPGSGPPLLPLVDRVIAAFARRVDQATPPDGLLVVLPASNRVYVHAKWSVRVTDPRKLAYRTSDVDQCVDMLVHVRIRDMLSAIPPDTDLDDPSVLKRVSDAVRAGVDSTAARFGVSCPHFKVLSLRPVDEKPHRSLSLADVSTLPDYYTSGIDTVLPELPRDTTNPGIHSFSSLPSLPPPNNINYPQPIAYPQPPQPPRRPPALASVRLPPPVPPSTPTSREPNASDDDSLYRLHDSPEILPRSQSFRELPATSSRQNEAAEQPKPDQMYARTQSLPQLLIPDEETSDALQPSCDLTRNLTHGVHVSERGGLAVDKPVSEERPHKEVMRALPVSEDESARPVPLQFSYPQMQQLPRETSNLTDEDAAPSEPHKRELLYAPPPSPTTPNVSAKNSSVLPEVLSNALEIDIKRSTFTAAGVSTSSPPERGSPPERPTNPADRASPPAEHISQPEERANPYQNEAHQSPLPGCVPSLEHASPALERVSSPPEFELAQPKRASPPPEPASPPTERASPLPGRASPPPPELASTPSERASPPLERASPSAELASPLPPELASSSPEFSSTPPERASPPSDHFSPPWEHESPSSKLSSLPQLAASSLEPGSPLREQAQSVPERSSTVPPRTSSPPVPLLQTLSSDGFSPPPLANIFAATTPTPHSQLPSSEHSSDSPSASLDPPSARSPAGSPNGARKVNLARGESSESSDTSYKDAVDQPIPSPLMSIPVRGSETRERQGVQTFQTAHPSSVGQPAHVSQPRQALTPSSRRVGGPLLGPPMMPIPMSMHAATEHHPVLSGAAGSRFGSQTTVQDAISQTRSMASIPPRAPTPPMMPLSTPVREAASGHVASCPQHIAGFNRIARHAVSGEAVGANPTDPTLSLPLNLASPHAAEVDSRARHAISRGPDPAYGREVDKGSVRNYDSGYSSAEAVRGKEGGYDSEDTNLATRGKPLNSPPLKREPRKRRQHVQTASLFSSVVEKAERAIKTAGTSLSVDGPTRMPQVPSDPRNTGGAQTSTRGARVGVSWVGSLPKPETIREGVALRGDPESVRDKEMQRRRPEYMRDEAPTHRGGKRLRTTEEEENLARQEHARREKLMEELNKIQRRGAAGTESSDDDSTRMMIDDGSDEERERFNDDAAAQSGAHMRKRREKNRSRRRHAHDEGDVYDGDDSSSEEVCTDCGHHHHHEGHGYSSSHRKGRSRSRSKRSEGSHHERSDYDSEPRSVSRSRSGRERKGTSELSTESSRSGKSSSRDKHRSKKSSSSSRDRKIEKSSSSSSRSRSREGKRSHSKSRSSSKKREGEDKKRKESKSKSRHRDKRAVPTTEQLEYKYKETEVKSIYRHRLPESDSGPENPIPWYCEGQSQPEDTDLDDEVGGDSSDSGKGKHKRAATIYSSYGRRNRYGRRHRAHHNRTVTFLYDDQY